MKVGRSQAREVGAGRERSALGAGTRAAALLLLAVPACRRSAPPPAAAQVPARVENRQSEASLPLIELTADAERRLGIDTRPVARRTMARERSYGGEVIAPPGRELTLHAPFAGRIASKEGAPRVGARVAAGEPLLKLAPLVPPERQILSAAERTSVARARADLDLLRSQLDAELETLEVEREAESIAAERAQALLEAGSGSARARDEAQARLELAQKRIAATNMRRDALDDVVLEVEETRELPVLAVDSPWSGTITALEVAAGEIVPAGAPLVRIADDGERWVRVELPASDAAGIARDAAARVRPLGERDAAAAVLARPVTAAPRGDFARATVERFFAVPPESARFDLGERVSVALALPASADALVVPAAALIRDVHGGAWVYLRRGERRYARARVELERVEGELAVLARGPQVGSEVVVAGAAELYGTEFGAGK